MSVSQGHCFCRHQLMPITPTTLLVIGQREFAGLIDEVPGLAHKILTALAVRVRELDDKIFP